MFDVFVSLAKTWACFTESANVFFSFKRHVRENRAEHEEERRRWSLEILPPFKGGVEGWRMVRLTRTHKNAPRAYLHAVELLAPANAQLAPQDRTAFDEYRPDIARRAARLSFELEMPAASRIDLNTAEIVYFDYAYAEFFASMIAGEGAKTLRIGVEAHLVAGERKRFRLELDSQPIV